MLKRLIAIVFTIVVTTYSVQAQSPFGITSAKNNTTTASGTLTITAPTSIIDGNLLIAGIAGNTFGTIAAPTGWSTVVAQFTSGTSRLTIFKKIASSESGNYTFTQSGAFMAGSVVNISGEDTTTPIDVNGTGSTGTGTTATATAVTVVTSNSLLLYFSGSDGLGAIGIPSGWTDTGNNNAAVNAEGYSSGYDPSLYATGSTGSKTAATQSPWTCVLVAIRPAAASGRRTFMMLGVG